MSDVLLPPERPVDGEEVLRRSAGRWQRDLPRWVTVAVFSVFALVVGGFAASRPSGYLAGGPGPVFDLSDQLGDTPGDTGWLLLTVSYEELSWAALARHHLTGGDGLVLGPGQFDDDLQRRATEQMAEARAVAADVAGERLGWAVTEPDLDLPGVGGASGGLAMTLALLDSYSDGDLAGGQAVAVTGTIAADGSVGPVGGVAYKAQAAAAAGATVLIVPRTNAAAVPADLGLTVVPVEHVDEAVAWLCAHDGTSSVC